jgi:hypothetical protein
MQQQQQQRRRANNSKQSCQQPAANMIDAHAAARYLFTACRLHELHASSWCAHRFHTDSGALNLTSHDNSCGLTSVCTATLHDTCSLFVIAFQCLATCTACRPTSAFCSVFCYVVQLFAGTNGLTRPKRSPRLSRELRAGSIAVPQPGWQTAEGMQPYSIRQPSPKEQQLQQLQRQ